MVCAQMIIDLIAERAALDLEELALLADKTFVDGGNADNQAYLAQLDGWIKRSDDDGNVVDAANATVSRRSSRLA